MSIKSESGSQKIIIARNRKLTVMLWSRCGGSLYPRMQPRAVMLLASSSLSPTICPNYLIAIDGFGPDSSRFE